jgi:hypothetical protein
MRLFVLLTWHPALGVTADPVGVLGLEDSTGGTCKHYVSWVPLSSQTGSGWRSRLAAPPTTASVTSWLADEGACQLAEIPAPAGAVSLPDAVEGALDTLLAEVIPRLPPREDR